MVSFLDVFFMRRASFCNGEMKLVDPETIFRVVAPNKPLFYQEIKDVAHITYSGPLNDA